jgi:hypothetical protein
MGKKNAFPECGQRESTGGRQGEAAPGCATQPETVDEENEEGWVIQKKI